MNTVETHIVELLKKHDCVVVPDFGGFLLKHRHTRISASAHEIFPPCKEVIFNRSINANDGLLINYVASSNGISYLEAGNVVKNFAATQTTKLLDTSSLELEGIGSFSLGEEGNWQFIPKSRDNFLLSSFGLSALQLSPVEAKSAESKTNKQKANSDKAVILPFATKKDNNNKPKKMYWLKGAAVAATVVLVASFSVLLYNNNSSNFSLNNYFASGNDDIQPASAIVIHNSAENEAAQSANIQPEQNSENNYGYKEESAQQQMQSAGFNFFVIGGSFTKEKNAKAFAKQLESKGYKSEVLDNENGFFRVAYHKERDSLNADQFLQGIKKENQSAWILKW